jgi:hypothetical protein
MSLIARVFLAIVGGIGLLTGVVLLSAPGATEDYFAWPINPPSTAVFMGAGYLGTGLTLISALALRLPWRAVQLIFRPIVVFAAIMIAATLMHADRFRWERPVTWLWLGAYAVLIVGAIIVERMERRGEASPGSRFTPLERLALVGVGSVTALVALGLFAAPAIVSQLWPWALSSLTARVVAGWSAVAAALALLAAWTDDRTSARLPLAGWVMTVVLFLATALVTWSGPGLGEPRTMVFFVSLGSSILGAYWLIWRVYPRSPTEP